MASVNKVIIIGNLGKDPETRYMTDGNQVAQFSLATTEKWKDKNGEVQARTDWHRIVMYRKLAEIAAQYLKKGSSVYIEGRLSTKEYTDKEGVKRYITEIIADTMKMLGSKPADQGASPSNQTSSSSKDDGSFDDNEDIPF
jgi:single-strand DNA-binding protein